jgi:hypothetical protein
MAGLLPSVKVKALFAGLNFHIAAVVLCQIV